MEDRHSLSAPRPKTPSDTSSLVWLVDIYRNGVLHPIDTIEISEQTLPPRLNKKGKVVWRLPTDTNRLPAFGVNEQARIMDLFKERKKNRKKKGNSNNRNTSKHGTDDTSSVTNNENRDYGVAINYDNNNKLNDNESQLLQGEHNVDDNPTKGSKQTNNNHHNDSNKKNDNSNNLNQPSSAKKKKNKKKNKTPTSSIIESEEEEFDPSTVDDHKCDSASTMNESQESNLPSQPLAPLPPPGFHDSMTSLTINDDYDDQNDDPPQNDKHVGEHLQFASLPTLLMDNPVVSPTHSHNNTAFISPLHQTIPQNYIVIPQNERPNINPLSSNVSLSVAAAKTFIEIYYSHILHGLSSKLATYYTPHAQKSISVGGAHHVVATQADIMLQLSKFSGSNFMVRGVVSQDTFDNKGAHVLITGVVQTTLNDQTCFAHSVSLVKKQNPLYSFSSNSDDEFSFQIHNDALTLLTMNDLVSDDVNKNIEQNPQPIQQI